MGLRVADERPRAQVGLQHVGELQHGWPRRLPLQVHHVAQISKADYLAGIDEGL